jgi:hypothetical protein
MIFGASLWELDLNLLLENIYEAIFAASGVPLEEIFPIKLKKLKNI